MPQDSFSTTTRTSWFRRLGSSIGGVIVGLLVLVLGTGLLAWNEARSVAAIRTANEGGRQVVTVAADRVDPAMNTRLVHVSGPLTAGTAPLDGEMGISIDGLRLARTVEHYQWIETSRSETRTRLGGGEETVTTYDYAKGWSPQPVSSGSFQRPAGHANPEPVLKDSNFAAQGVRLGVFRLDADMAGRLPIGAAVVPTAENAQRAAGRLGRPVAVAGDALYVGRNPAQPAVGDARIRYAVAPVGPGSALAGQDGDRLVPFQTRHGVIFDLRPGQLDAAEMIRQAKTENQILSWILRVGGFALIAFGIGLVLNPLKVAADVLPFVGSLVGAGTGMVAFVLASLISSLVIGLSWLAVRPLVGLGCLAIAAAMAVAVVVLRRRRRPDAVALS